VRGISEGRRPQERKKANERSNREKKRPKSMRAAEGRGAKGYSMKDEKQIGRDWRGKEYSYISHRRCESFPCHETDSAEDFNCLFCYCPLYALGEDCGGDFRYLPDGVKDCALCAIPHRRDNYGYITGRFQDIVKKMKQK
jgi:Zn-finger protein